MGQQPATTSPQRGPLEDAPQADPARMWTGGSLVAFFGKLSVRRTRLRPIEPQRIAPPQSPRRTRPTIHGANGMAPVGHSCGVWPWRADPEALQPENVHHPAVQRPPPAEARHCHRPTHFSLSWCPSGPLPTARHPGSVRHSCRPPAHEAARHPPSWRPPTDCPPSAPPAGCRPHAAIAPMPAPHHRSRSLVRSRWSDPVQASQAKAGARRSG